MRDVSTGDRRDSWISANWKRHLGWLECPLGVSASPKHWGRGVRCVCAHMCVCVWSPKAVLVHGKVFNCKSISEHYRTQQYLFPNNLGVFGVCLDLVNFHCGQRCTVFHSRPTHFKGHDLIKHFFTFNCMPRPQGIICWVAPSELEWGQKDMSV